jgi:hypothetical protein
MKRARPFPDGPPLFDDADASTSRRSLKNHARSLSRLLNAPGLPKTARKDKARLLRKLQARLTEKSQQAREQRYAERYKAVRFFERQKAARRLRRAERDAAAGAAGAAAEVQRCRDDLAYVTWFPRHLRYVALFASKVGSADPKLAARRAALRAWALANAAARAYLLQPPGAAAAAGAGDTDSEEDEGAEGEGDSEDQGGKGGGGGAETAGKAWVRSPASRQRAAPAFTAAATFAAAPAPPAAAAAFRLPPRPAPPPPRSHPRGAGGAPADGEDVDELADGAFAAGADGEDVRALLGGDAFFSGPLPAGASALPVFVEEEPHGGAGAGGGDAPWVGGAWRSGGGALGRRLVAGAPHAAARYEREHMHAPRYKDVAAIRGESAAGTERPPPPLQQQQQQRGAPDASDRKRRRVERAMAHSNRAADGGGAAARFTEYSFGTSADPYARLKSAERLVRAAKKDAAAGGGGGSTRGAPPSRGAPRANPAPIPPPPVRPAAALAAGGMPPGPTRKDKKRSVLLRFDEE